ncbi:MAG: class I SAM-dependent methyltransferase [archaeon]|jgi:SAM-dependent methyltransferase
MIPRASRIKRSRVKLDRFVTYVGNMGRYKKEAVASKTAPGEILWALEQARKGTSCGENLRVLEVGGGSGRLARTLIKMGQVKPQNYFLMDKAYESREPHRFVTVNKTLQRLAKDGTFNILHGDISGKPPSLKGGQVNLIFASSVSGCPDNLYSLLKNYFGLLSPGGFLVIDRAESTWITLRWLNGKGTQDYQRHLPPHFREQEAKGYTPHSVEEEYARRLKEELDSLQKKGKIAFANHDNLFARTWTWCPNIFVLQKLKD